MLIRCFFFSICFVGLQSINSFAGTTLINLTQTEVEGITAQSDYTIGDGEFLISSIGASGSGVLSRWYGLQDDNDDDSWEYGYNYDGSEKPLPMDEKTGGVMDPELHIGDMYTVEYNGEEYVEFVLDVNENDKLISLDSFELYVYDDPYTSPYVTNYWDRGQLGDLVYDMDESVNYSVLIEETGSGSGSTDLTVLVNKDVFDGYSADSKVYLFSKFGKAGTLQETSGGIPTGESLNFGVSDGFEEWGFRSSGGGYSAVPEASTVVTGSLLGVGLVGFAFLRRRRRS